MAFEKELNNNNKVSKWPLSSDIKTVQNLCLIPYNPQTAEIKMIDSTQNVNEIKDHLCYVMLCYGFNSQSHDKRLLN